MGPRGHTTTFYYAFFAKCRCLPGSQREAIELRKSRMLLPSALPFTTKQVGPRVNSWGRESSVDIICKPKQGGGGEQTKTHKNPCLQLCTQSQGPGGVARKQGLCGGGSVCKCHVCMYAIHGLFNSTVHRGVETKITKVQLATGSNVLWRQIEGGTPGKAPRLFRKGARVCYRFWGASLHMPHLRQASAAPSASF